MCRLNVRHVSLVVTGLALFLFCFSSTAEAQSWVTFDRTDVAAGKTLKYPFTIVSGDFNRDGYLDAAVANAGADPASGAKADGGVSILLNSFSGFGGPYVEYGTGSNTVGLVSGDFNGDGKIDLAATNFGSNTLSILLGDGDGFFANPTSLPTGSSPAFVVAADFNGDGKLDLAVSNFGANSVSVFLGQGNGSFAAKTDFTTEEGPIGLVAADFNHDNKLDLAAACIENDKISILMGNGTGSFSAKNDLVAATDPFWLIATDFNRDGHLDLITSNEGLSSLLFGLGDGSFTAKRDYGWSPSEDIQGLAVADVDLDGNPDLLAVNNESGLLHIAPGDGRGWLGPARKRISLEAGAQPGGMVVGLFDSDQRPDVVVASSNLNHLNILKNTSSIAYTLVPIVLSVAGANNSFYTSEMTLTNRGSAATEINLTYKPSFGSGGGTGGISLAAGQQLVVPDVISWLRTLNIPIPDSGNRGGTLAVQFTRLSCPADGAVTVRTTTRTTDGRAGLAYPDIHSWIPFISEQLFIGGLRQNSQDRSNLAFLHAGLPTDPSITLRVTVISGDPANPVVQTLADEVLSPGEFRQINNILTSNGMSVSQGFVRVMRVGTAVAPFYAYGVINDQANSDGSFIAPIPASSQTVVRGLTVPVMVETPAFKSELVAINITTIKRKLTFAYVADAIQTPDNTARFTMELQPLEQRIIPDFVNYLRTQGVEGIGPEGPTYAGALFATVDADVAKDAQGVYLSARTASPGGGGQYGLFYPAVPCGQTASQTAWLYGLQQNAENRSNLALVNTGEADNSPNVFRIELFDGERGEKVQTLEGVTVAAKRWVQISGILSKASGTTQGYARITRVSGSNPFIAYAVINDGGAPGERSGDGAFISMERGE